MSAEHRRQLLAFFIVALAAVLLVGTTLHSQYLRDGISGRSGSTAGAIATGVTIIPGLVGVELGGSARGTTAPEPVLAEVAQPTASRGTSIARSTSPNSTSPNSTSSDSTPARSDATPKALRAAQPSGSPGKSKQLAAQSTAKSVSGVSAYRAGATAKGKGKGKGKSDSAHAKKAEGKKAEGKKHGNGKSQAHHARRA